MWSYCGKHLWKPSLLASCQQCSRLVYVSGSRWRQQQMLTVFCTWLYMFFSLSSCWISRSLHNKLRLGTGSSSSLTDLSQAKTSAGGGEKGGTAGGLADDCSRDKGTQQRRAGANATWNRSVHWRFSQSRWIWARNVCVGVSSNTFLIQKCLCAVSLRIASRKLC